MIGDAMQPSAMATLADFLLKGGALLILVFAAAALARRRSAAERALIWGTGLTGLLAVAIAAPLAPKWSWAVLPAGWGKVQAVAAGAESTAIAPQNAGDEPAIHSDDRADRAARSDTSYSPGSPRTQEAASAPSPVAAAVAPSIAQPSNAAKGEPAIPKAKSIALAWPRILSFGWGLGVLLALAPMGFGLMQVRRKLKRARPLGGADWDALMDELRGTLGIARRVGLLIGEAGEMPTAAGWLRETILLPAEAEGWPAAMRRGVLAHELAHVRRRDCLMQALGRLAAALHWPDPLAWIALARLRGEREQACDDLALAAGSAAADYADTLLKIARTMQARQAIASAAATMARTESRRGARPGKRPGKIERRLLAILDASRRRGSVGRRGILLGLAAILLVALPLSMAQLTESEAYRNPDPALRYLAWKTHGDQVWNASLAHADSSPKAKAIWTPDGTAVAPGGLDVHPAQTFFHPPGDEYTRDLPQTRYLIVAFAFGGEMPYWTELKPERAEGVRATGSRNRPDPERKGLVWQTYTLAVATTATLSNRIAFDLTYPAGEWSEAGTLSGTPGGPVDLGDGLSARVIRIDYDPKFPGVRVEIVDTKTSVSRICKAEFVPNRAGRIKLNSGTAGGETTISGPMGPGKRTWGNVAGLLPEMIDRVRILTKPLKTARFEARLLPFADEASAAASDEVNAAGKAIDPPAAAKAAADASLAAVQAAPDTPGVASYLVNGGLGYLVLQNEARRSVRAVEGMPVVGQELWAAKLASVQLEARMDGAKLMLNVVETTRSAPPLSYNNDNPAPRHAVSHLKMTLAPSATRPGDWDLEGLVIDGKVVSDGGTTSAEPWGAVFGSSQTSDASLDPAKAPLRSFLHRVDDSRLAAYYRARLAGEPDATALPLIRALDAAHPGDSWLLPQRVELEARAGDLAAADAAWARWQAAGLGAGDPLLDPARRAAAASLEKARLGREHPDLSNLHATAPEAMAYLPDDWTLERRLAWLREIGGMDGLLHWQDRLVAPVSSPRWGGNGIPKFLEAQTLAKTVQVESVFDLMAGRREEGLEILAGSYRLGQSMNAEGPMIERLVGVSLRRFSMFGLDTYALNAYSTPYELMQFNAALARLDKTPGQESGATLMDGEQTPLMQRMIFKDTRYQPEMMEASTRHRVVDARWAILRTATAARGKYLADGQWPAAPGDFARWLPEGLPADPFAAPAPIRSRRDGEDLVAWSVGPDRKDDQGAFSYDPTNGTISPGDLLLRVPAKRVYPFPKEGVKADNASQLLAHFPNGLPADPFAITSRFPLSILEGDANQPVVVFSWGPDSDQARSDSYRGPQADAEKSGAELQRVFQRAPSAADRPPAGSWFLEPMYDPTNGTASRGDLYLELPRRTHASATPTASPGMTADASATASIAAVDAFAPGPVRVVPDSPVNSTERKSVSNSLALGGARALWLGNRTAPSGFGIEGIGLRPNEMIHFKKYSMNPDGTPSMTELDALKWILDFHLMVSSSRAGWIAYQIEFLGGPADLKGRISQSWLRGNGTGDRMNPFLVSSPHPELPFRIRAMTLRQEPKELSGAEPIPEAMIDENLLDQTFTISAEQWASWLKDANADSLQVRNLGDPASPNVERFKSPGGLSLHYLLDPQILASAGDFASGRISGYDARFSTVTLSVEFRPEASARLRAALNDGRSLWRNAIFALHGEATPFGSSVGPTGGALALSSSRIPLPREFALAVLGEIAKAGGEVDYGGADASTGANQVATAPGTDSAAVEDVMSPQNVISRLDARLNFFRLRKIRLEYARMLKDGSTRRCTLIAFGGSYRETERLPDGRVLEHYSHRTSTKMDAQRDSAIRADLERTDGAAKIEFQSYSSMHWADSSFPEQWNEGFVKRYADAFRAKTLKISPAEGGKAIALSDGGQIGKLFDPAHGMAYLGAGTPPAFSEFESLGGIPMPQLAEALGWTDTLTKMEIDADFDLSELEIPVPKPGDAVAVMVELWPFGDKETGADPRTSAVSPMRIVWSDPLRLQDRRAMIVAQSRWNFDAYMKAVAAGDPLPWMSEDRKTIIWATHDSNLHRWVKVGEGDASPAVFGEAAWTDYLGRWTEAAGGR